MLIDCQLLLNLVVLYLIGNKAANPKYGSMILTQIYNLELSFPKSNDSSTN